MYPASIVYDIKNERRVCWSLWDVWTRQPSKVLNIQVHKGFIESILNIFYGLHMQRPPVGHNTNTDMNYFTALSEI